MNDREAIMNGPSSSNIDLGATRGGPGGRRTNIEWHTGLYNCLDDAGICVWGLCCLPCQFGENASLLYATEKENGECMLSCCLYALCFPLCCCIGGLFRRDLRQKYGLKHEPCGDCFVHLCCFPCAICQEAREIKFRGPPYQHNN